MSHLTLRDLFQVKESIGLKKEKTKLFACLSRPEPGNSWKSYIWELSKVKCRKNIMLVEGLSEWLNYKWIYYFTKTSINGKKK